MTQGSTTTYRHITELPEPPGQPRLGILHQLDLPRLHQPLESQAATDVLIHCLRMVCRSADIHLTEPAMVADEKMAFALSPEHLQVKFRARAVV